MTASATQFVVPASFPLTKREYIAALAMQGLCADPDMMPSHIPFQSVELADALIAELEKQP